MQAKFKKLPDGKWGAEVFQTATELPVQKGDVILVKRKDGTSSRVAVIEIISIPGLDEDGYVHTIVAIKGDGKYTGPRKKKAPEQKRDIPSDPLTLVLGELAQKLMAAKTFAEVNEAGYALAEALTVLFDEGR